MKAKLTLRDIFSLVLVIGLGLAWWLDRSQLNDMNERLESRHRSLIGLMQAKDWEVQEFEDGRLRLFGPKP